MKHLIGVITVFWMLSCGAEAQQGFEFPIECVRLQLDRTTFFSNEPLQFSAFIFVQNATQNDHLSKVLYTELIDKNGVSVSRTKTIIDESFSSGLLEFPEDIISGTYILRSYTHYQLNRPVNQWAMCAVRVVNPDLKTASLAMIPVLRQIDPIRETDEICDIQFAEGKLSMHLTSSVPGINAIGYSVIKKGMLNENWVSLTDDRENLQIKTDDSFVLPEIRGVGLSGKLLNTQTNESLANKRILATVLLGYRQLHATTTDEHGNFYFTIPHTSAIQRVYLTAFTEYGATEILVQNDFSTSIPQLAWVVDTLIENEILSLNQNYKDAQVCSEFVDQFKANEFLRPPPFPLSAPTKTIILDDFVKLGTLEEVLNEITPFASVKNKGESHQVIMFDHLSKTTFEEPLILVDFLPYTDVDQLLNLDVDIIKSIDIFAEAVLIGDVEVKGVLNINTSEGFLGGLELLSQTVVVDYMTISTLKPVDHSNLSFNPCNTVYWKPLHRPSSQETFTISGLMKNQDYQLVVTFVDERGITHFQIKDLTAD